MSAGANGARRLGALLRPSTLDSAVCRSCQDSLFRRSYSTETAASTTTQTPLDLGSTPSSGQPPLLRPTYNIKAGAVLSRTPRITRDLTPFEKSFYFYQRRLNERLALPFTRYFYFKRGTPADVEWKRTLQERQTPSRDIGNYSAYSKEAWNDELIAGAKESEPQHQVESLVRDAEGYLSSDSVDGMGKKEELPRPADRVTEADLKGDMKSLDRLLQRTLYLLVQAKEGYWKFPSVNVQMEQETLKEAAERALLESAGPDMNKWMVGYHPVGHYVYNRYRPLDNTETGTQLLGEKTFFLKSRIMAGQAKVDGNIQDIVDFKWLSKEEIQKHVIPPYWSSIKNMMSER